MQLSIQRALFSVQSIAPYYYLCQTVWYLFVHVCLLIYPLIV